MRLEHLSSGGQEPPWTKGESDAGEDTPARAEDPAPFAAILVWKLSRFARNREDSIIYKSFLRKHGVQVISINEPVSDRPTGRMLEGIIEVIDEFYSAKRGQDVPRHA